MSEPVVETIATQFEKWWHEEGSAMPPLPSEDAEDHVHRVCKFAWLNGAIKALEAT